MKWRDALPIITGAAMVAMATASIGAPAPGAPKTGGALANGLLAGVAGDDSPDVIEVRHYKLTLEKAQKTAAAMQSINQLVAANPSLNAALDAGSSTTGKKPITEQAADIDSKYPQIASIIHTNGLATREFIVVTGALINDLGFVMMKKQGMIKAYPPGMITPENIALIEGNTPAFEEIAAKMQPPSTR
jgi:hypothetical protein